MFSIERRGASATLYGPEGRYSYYNPREPFTGMGWDAESASLLLLPHPARRILILGLGGGTVARQLRLMFPTVEITGVEIDAAILRASKQIFAIDSAGVRSVLCDGEAFVRHGRSSFDAIIDDMWDHALQATRVIHRRPDWLASVQRRLTPRGIYAINLYSRAEDPGGYQQALKALDRHFPVVVEARLHHESVTVLAGVHESDAARAARRRLREMPPSARTALSRVRFATRTSTRRRRC